MNDRSLPWLILVPEREDVREIYDLSGDDRQELMDEIVRVSRVIKLLYSPDKINIGALGNLVPQLHIHVIGRYTTDRAWPGPIWGVGPMEPYSPDEVESVCERIKKAF